MTSLNMFSLIREVIRPTGAALTPVDADPAGASETIPPLQTGAQRKEASMANETPAPGADVKPGIAEADHKAAVAKASADGIAEGTKSANDRLAAVINAEGVKRDGKRMAAGIDLALKSPDMAAADVVAFVTGNVAAAADAGKGASYEQQRLAASALVQPNGGQPANGPAEAQANKAGWASAFNRLHS